MTEKLKYIFSCSSSGRPYCRQEVSNFRVYDNACVVFEGQKVVYAGEAERFTKLRHDFKIPIWGLKSFLREIGLSSQSDIEMLPFDCVSVDHTMNHVYASFYLSGFRDALVLVNDQHGTDCRNVALAFVSEGSAPRLLETLTTSEVVLGDQNVGLGHFLNKYSSMSHNLCLTGSSFLDVAYNSKIVELGIFNHYYVNPQPTEGCSEAIGTALRIMELSGEKLKSRRLESPYLGTPYAIDAEHLPFYKIENPRQFLFKHLKAGNVIAWFQGGSEYGPRSLGHRSFFADPRADEMIDTLRYIKGCDQNEQFTLVIPDRLFRLVFDEKNADMCEFAARSMRIKHPWKEKLRSVSSCGEYAQPQLLKRKVNPQLYDLLMNYFELSGVPCLLGASLSVNDFPMVETPRDLLDVVEEISYVKCAPKVVTVFVDKDQFYEVEPENLQHETD